MVLEVAMACSDPMLLRETRIVLSMVQQIVLWRHMLVGHGGVGMIAGCFGVDGGTVVVRWLYTLAWRV